MANKDGELLGFIEEVTRNSETVQQNVLAEILNENAETEYLKGFHLNGATDPETFKSKVPVISYEDIQPLIRRIADGDPSPILTAQPIYELIISSGTSGGERKLIPSTKEEMDRMQFIQTLRTPIINMHVKGVDQGKGLHFMFTKAVKKTKGGITAQSSTSSFFKRLARNEHLQNIMTSPGEAILCVDTFQSMYAQMLCGLYEAEHVTHIGGAFASSLVWAFKFLEQNWQQLTYDIRVGSLNPKVVDASIRECMTRVLIRPQPELADFIANECLKDDWEGIVARIWPNAKYLDAIATGTMSQYISTLDYYTGGLPIVSMIYVSSECFFGLNLDPLCKPSEVVYTIMPNMAYFEFLPLDHDSCVDLVDVKIGKEYEIVVTTRAGLYRYRVGDILRVTGFHNSVPQLKFCRRRNVVLCVDADKTTEVELQAAVDNVSRLLQRFNTIVVEYTSSADTETFPGHYVIYLELQARDLANPPSNEVLDECCLVMEDSLDTMYRFARVSLKSIGPLEIRVVENGTFEELMELAISQGSFIGQYKVPRCVALKPSLDLLNSRVVSKHVSSSLPHWTLDSLLKE